MSFKLAFSQHVRIEIRDRDHEPAHVHVLGPSGAEAVFLLEDLSLQHCKGFSAKSVKLIRVALEENRVHLMEVWNEIHG